MEGDEVVYALRLSECTADRADLVGGKAVGLGNLLRVRPGDEVPPGFVITTQAYRDWLADRRLEQDLRRILAEVEREVDEAVGQEVSRRVLELFEGAQLSGPVLEEVSRAYTDLGAGQDVPVAVRSSATAEDGSETSFAGQQESYLGVVGLPAVARNVCRCWASLFTPHAISYRRRHGMPLEAAAMAVVVQRMVAADVSGVMLTIDPVSGDRSQIAIEGAFGLGLPVVGGELTPDRYHVDKVTLEIRSTVVAQKPFADRLDPMSGAVRRVKLGEEGGRPCLRDEEVMWLAEVGKQVERALGCPQDIEWAIGPGPGGERHLYLLQSRPETVWSRRPTAPVAAPRTTAMDRIVAMMVGGSRNVSTQPGAANRGSRGGAEGA
jgi:phosphoenolpyruvate synthase/pyruvate phosphate dikinase